MKIKGKDIIVMHEQGGGYTLHFNYLKEGEDIPEVAIIKPKKFGDELSFSAFEDIIKKIQNNGGPQFLPYAIENKSSTLGLWIEDRGYENKFDQKTMIQNTGTRNYVERQLVVRKIGQHSGAYEAAIEFRQNQLQMTHHVGDLVTKDNQTLTKNLLHDMMCKTLKLPKEY